MWPIEAKVIKSDKQTDPGLIDYVETINKRFLVCKYAPFSPSAAMLAYFNGQDYSQLRFVRIPQLERRLIVRYVRSEQHTEGAHHLCSKKQQSSPLFLP
jgi:hypothetical protein